MARGRGSPVRWTTKFTWDPMARQHTLGQPAVRSQMQETGRIAKKRIASNVRNSAYRNRLMYRTYKENGEWKLWVGTYSSFAHWEEFGQIKWKGPIAPMRRALSSMGWDWNDRGPNSQRPSG